jgi:hypothetical protein
VVDGDLVSVAIMEATPIHLQGELIHEWASHRREKAFDNPGAPIYHSVTSGKKG